jgi:hypothetical protein
MSILASINQAIETHNRHVAAQIQRARTDPAFQQELLTQWQAIQSGIETVTTPTGLKLPRLALPQTDEPGEIAHLPVW